MRFGETLKKIVGVGSKAGSAEVRAGIFNTLPSIPNDDVSAFLNKNNIKIEDLPLIDWSSKEDDFSQYVSVLPNKFHHIGHKTGTADWVSSASTIFWNKKDKKLYRSVSRAA